MKLFKLTVQEKCHGQLFKSSLEEALVNIDRSQLAKTLTSFVVSEKLSLGDVEALLGRGYVVDIEINR